MKRTTAAFLSVCITLAISACAHHPVNPDAVRLASGIIIDAKGKDRQAVLRDGDECAGIAEATAPESQAATGAVAGAIVGAIAGALIYRAAGLSGDEGARYGAGLGGLSGGTSGAVAGAQDYNTVIRNCMIGRGHEPLN